VRNLNDCRAALSGMTSLFRLWTTKNLFQPRKSGATVSSPR